MRLGPIRASSPLRWSSLRVILQFQSLQVSLVGHEWCEDPDAVQIVEIRVARVVSYEAIKRFEDGCDDGVQRI